MSRSDKILSYLTELAAETPSVGHARIAAAILRGPEWISVATNKRKTHPIQARYAKNNRAIYLHAEIHTIIKALKVLEVADLRSCDLYIARVTGTNRVPAPVHPCKGCAKAISEFGIRRVYTS